MALKQNFNDKHSFLLHANKEEEQIAECYVDINTKLVEVEELRQKKARNQEFVDSLDRNSVRKDVLELPVKSQQAVKEIKV